MQQKAAAGSESARPAAPDRRATEAALVRRARAGEAAAFAELVRAHQPRIFRLARNIVGGEEDARDLGQEAFLRAFRGLAGFDERREFGAWLTRIAVNLCLDCLRRRRRRPAAETIAAALPAPAAPRDPILSLELRELRQTIDRLLLALPPHYRAALVLREVEGLESREVARILGIGSATVRWRLHRARRLFRAAWLAAQERRAAGPREERRP